MELTEWVHSTEMLILDLVIWQVYTNIDTCERTRKTNGPNLYYREIHVQIQKTVCVKQRSDVEPFLRSGTSE